MAKNNSVAEVTFNLEVEKKIFLVFVLQKFHIKPQILFFGAYIAQIGRSL